MYLINTVFYLNPKNSIIHVYSKNYICLDWEFVSTCSKVWRMRKLTSDCWTFFVSFFSYKKVGRRKNFSDKTFIFENKLFFPSSQSRNFVFLLCSKDIRKLLFYLERKRRKSNGGGWENYFHGVNQSSGG